MSILDKFNDDAIEEVTKEILEDHLDLVSCDGPWMFEGERKVNKEVRKAIKVLAKYVSTAKEYKYFKKHGRFPR